MPGFILNDGAVVPPSVYSDMNTVLNKKLGTSQVYPPRDWAAIVKDLVPLPLKSASGSIAHFKDGADNVPLKSLTYRFTPTQSGTGDPSPSNPRPINAVTTANVVHAGKNLFTTEGEETTSFLKSDGTITTGSGANGWNLSDYIEVKEGVTYYFNPNTTAGTTAKAGYFDASKNFVSAINSGAISFTVPSGIKYMRFSYRSTSTDIQLEVGSTPTTYEPFTSTTHPVDFGTVYGGEGNEAGEFTSTYKLADLLTMDWDSNAPNQDGYIRFVSHSAFEDKKNGYNLLCDKFPVKTSLVPSSPTTIGISGYTSNANIYIAVESSMLTGDLSTNAGRNTAFRNWISDNGLQILYELATPTTLSVDPVAINSRLGVNNIYLDLAGSEIECEYYADPTLSTL